LATRRLIDHLIGWAHFAAHRFATLRHAVIVARIATNPAM